MTENYKIKYIQDFLELTKLIEQFKKDYEIEKEYFDDLRRRVAYMEIK